MLDIDNYQVEQRVRESRSSDIFRGRRRSDGRPVILKVLKGEPRREDLTRYRQEFALLRGLDLPGVIKAQGFEKHSRTPFLVMEDFGGDSLDLVLERHGRFAPLRFLEIAISLTEALAQVHHERIIHKDINPSNVVLNLETGVLKIIDFGISTKLPREDPTIRNPSVIEGTLAYMSPEQTGRMNRSLDYRTDFYSLGVTFYELLTGTLPFPSDDALALVHCHIAKQPPAPAEVVPEIPRPISDIVMKLLEKNAENRYQSAHGLEADLERCAQALRAGEPIEPFALGRDDASGLFQIPQKLYGREHEVETLLHAFDRISGDVRGTDPHAEILMVTGYSGIGKSALVKEIYRSVTRKSGYFISGKFDQFQRGVPYSAVAEAFSDLVRQLLTESAPRLQRWRQRNAEAVGTNGRVIADVIPEIELILGPIPEIEKLGATEARNRFDLVFLRFIHALCRAEHPLVLFLDDLQWADSPSLALIANVMRDESTANLLVIGAYRDNEVEPTHPLAMALDSLRGDGVTIEEITLPPLGLGHISRMLADTLSRTLQEVEPLASLVLGKTGGNPFFAKQFLTVLFSEGMLSFERQRWVWDIAQIESMGITDNVVELMIGKLAKLPEGTRQALRLAACMGSRFDLETLATISGKPAEDLFFELMGAVSHGLIIPTSKLESHSDGTLALDLLILNFKFLHDRVQQAAYATIEEEQRTAVHLQIGRILLENAGGELDAQIFDVVEHLNLGAELVTDRDERDAHAELNLAAGRKAREAMAHGPALQFLRAGLRLLSADSWQRRYRLTFELHVGLVEVHYLNANMEEARRLSQEVLRHAETRLDRVEVYELQMMALVAQNEHAASIDVAREALALLGVTLPRDPAEMASMAEALRAEVERKVTSIEALADLPIMEDPYQLAKLRILVNTSAPAYNALPALLPAILWSQTKLCVEHGNSSMACVAYVWQAIIVGGLYKDIDSAYRYGLLAMKTLESFNARESKAKIHNLFNGFVRPWKEHVRQTMAPMVEGFQSGMETGDIEFGLYSAIQYCNNLLHIGEPLESVARQRGHYHALAVRLRQHYHTDYFSVGNQVVLNLLGRAEDPCVLVGEVLDETVKLPEWEAVNNVTFAFITYHGKTLLNYLFGNYARAVELAEIAEKYEQGGTGLFYGAVQTFYQSLALLAHHATLAPEAQQAALAKVARNQERMRSLAAHAPPNFRHKLDLVRAEQARVSGDVLEAMNLYEAAIHGAREQGFTQEEALAYELAARLYLGLGRQEIAQAYMSRAYFAYSRWEAKAKLDQMRGAYPRLVFASRPAGQDSPTTTTVTDDDLLDRLDMSTVLKASQAISGQIVLGRLLEQILAIIMENAGAERGALIFERDHELFVEALGSVAGGVTVLGSEPVARSPELPVSLVQYVARTGESVVLDDASAAGRFQHEPYVVARQPRSILCAPIVKQSRRVGILYLENAMVAGAFSPKRLDVLEVLSAQAAISLENARLYDTLEQKVDQRTAELRAKNEELAHALDTLQRAQKQLVTQEKLASLGQITAGVAHEIRNPLNFINNFSTSSIELVDELIEELETHRAALPAAAVASIQEITGLISNNLRRVSNHGERANGIVTSMLMHAQHSTGAKERADINEVIREAMHLVAHGVHADHRNFDLTIEEDYDTSIGEVDIVVEDVRRVVLNLASNACYALRALQQRLPGHRPLIRVSTRSLRDELEIRMRDNGPGIPEAIAERVFHPFFTTKPPGEGTGLGLSISHDIITQKHDGTLRLESQPGHHTELIITIPKRARAGRPPAAV